MKTNPVKSTSGRQAVGLSGAPKNTSSFSKTSGLRGRGRKKILDDDKFADLNMRPDDYINDDISMSWTGSASKRKSYSDDAESDSYEGTGYARGRMDSYDDELTNDPYETFRRG
ncbi:MAG: hypothetical protein EOP53_25000 [Sphingobacteriales bacterium]|nr:MAG: hypothetical protein EOP53_25000 [Sphingobacteriales bacterium]